MFCQFDAPNFYVKNQNKRLYNNSALRHFVLFLFYRRINERRITMKHTKLTQPADSEPRPADYLGTLDGVDLNEAQELELLNVLFDIMRSFVLMGYGMEPVNKLVDAFECYARESADLVDSKHDDETRDREVEHE